MRPELRRIGAGAAIFDAAGSILLVRHTYGRCNWELPGGLGRAYESPVETALREVREETGLDVKVERLTGIYYDRPVDNLHFMFLSVARDGATPEPNSPEISACAYWPRHALPRPISDFTIRRIDDALMALPSASMEFLPAERFPRSSLED